MTKGLRLYDRDGLIIEGLDFGLRNIEREDERVERWVGATVGLIWDRLEKIGGPRDPERRTFRVLDVEVHLFARHWITAVSSDLNDDVLETIGLSKFFGTGEGTKVGLETVNMEELNDAGIEVATGNIIFVLLQDFIRTFEGCGELRGQEIFLRTADVEENKVTRLVDVLCGRVSGGHTLEFVGVSALLSSGAKRLKIVIEELDIFILTGELVRCLGQIHVDMIEVTEGEVVGTLGGLGVDVAVDDVEDGTKVLWLGPAIFYPFVLNESAEEDNNLFAVGLDAIGGMDIDERDTMSSTDPLEVHGDTIGHDIRSRVSGKLIVVAVGDTEGIEGLSNVKGRVLRDRISSDELGGGDYY